MKENSACIMCGYHCSHIDTKNGARLLQDDERDFYFNIQPIKDCTSRHQISEGASRDQARKNVIKGERIS